MTLFWVGLMGVFSGGGLMLFRRPLAAWNGRTADAWKSEHIRRVTEPDDGAPGYFIGVSAFILVVGAVLMIVGLVQG